MRQHYVDWLRNLSILFLFPYHVSRVFDDFSPFYVKGDINVFSTVVIHSSFWFMPLLFLLAGLSSYHGLRKRSDKTYAAERVSRLLVPFLVGCLIIVPPQSFYAEKFHRDYQGGYLEYLWSYFTDFSQWSEYAGGLTPAHLWFIAFLLLISLSTLPLMRTIINRAYTPRWLRQPLALILPFAGLAVLGWLPDVAGKNIFVFAGYFMLGFLIATDDRVIDTIRRHRLAYLLLAVAGTIAINIEAFTITRQTGMIATTWHTLVCWTALLAILGYGKHYLDRKSRFMTYFTPAAFPVYILHQTYLIIAGYYILQFSHSGILPFLAIGSTAFILSIATYEVIKRFTTTRILFGLGPSRPATPRPTAEKHDLGPPSQPHTPSGP